jgi:hypothetical protein
MESVTISSTTGKRGSRSSASSSEMSASKLDAVNSERQGRDNPSFHQEEDDIPVNQTYYADELISVPDLNEVYTIFFKSFIWSNFYIHVIT